MATTSNASETRKRVGRPPKGSVSPNETLTVVSDLAHYLLPELDAARGLQFPSPHYQNDPVAFAREVLGVEPWSKQVEILEAVRDNMRVAVRSGHKIGKSNCAAILALWFYCSWDSARVVMTSTTSRQVDAILWREIRMMRAASGKCVACKAAEAKDPGLRIARPCPHSTLILGELAETARSGLKALGDDFREVVGFTAKQAEAVAGVSGANVLYIGDEASGIAELIFNAIEGNRAGNARLVLFSNPTQNQGTFYDAFNSKSRFWKTITVSSEETPNVVSGLALVPGLATREWVEEKKDEWGEKSPLYIVRVKGLHAEHEQGKIFSVHAIGQAELRWQDTPAEGRLYIGLDPAGESGSGDDSVFAIRRGLRVIELVPRQGLNEVQHLTLLLMLIARHKLPRETPVVVVDSEGSVGAKVWSSIRQYAEDHAGVFEAVRVRASDKSMRQPEIYDRMRDALTASLAAWIEAGGAIPSDVKLAKEMHTVEWKQRADGKQKVTDKLTVRKLIGRSPDRYDAICLCVWEPLSLRESAADNDNGQAAAVDYYSSRAGGLDPYAGAAAWEKR